MALIAGASWPYRAFRAAAGGGAPNRSLSGSHGASDGGNFIGWRVLGRASRLHRALLWLKETWRLERRRSRFRRTFALLLIGAGALLLAALWLGPLAGAGGRSFMAHMVLHLAVVAVAAPLIAFGLLQALAGRRRLRAALLIGVAASFMEMGVVWGWHRPALHEAAASRVGLFAMLLTFMHMTMLGTGLAMSSRLVYAPIVCQGASDTRSARRPASGRRPDGLRGRLALSRRGDRACVAPDSRLGRLEGRRVAPLKRKSPGGHNPNAALTQTADLQGRSMNGDDAACANDSPTRRHPKIVRSEACRGRAPPARHCQRSCSKAIDKGRAQPEPTWKPQVTRPDRLSLGCPSGLS
jgi:putative membrane protein